MNSFLGKDSATYSESHPKHFTNISCLCGILERGLRFSHPNSSWDDKNDAKFVELYEREKKVTVSIACLCCGAATLHHWTYYGNKSNNSSFVGNPIVQKYADKKCFIRFDMEKLVQTISNYKKEHRDVIDMTKLKVDYQYISSIEHTSRHYGIDDLLILKRKGFLVDDEIRIICEYSNTEKSREIYLPISDCIENIVLDGHLTNEEYKELKEQLQKQFPFLHPNMIKHSKLFRSDRWINAVCKKIGISK